MSKIDLPLQVNNYNSFSEFANLTLPHKTLVMVVSIFVCLLTLGLAVPFAIPSLIGRLRKLEIDKATEQAKTAKKTDQTVKKVLVEKPKEVFHDDEVAIRHALAESLEEAENDKYIKEFNADKVVVDKIIDDLLEQIKIKGSKEELEAHQILEKYESYKKENDKKFNKFPLLSSGIIQNDIVKILKEKKEPPIEFPYQLSQTEEVITKPTVADGSCFFHALFGEVDDRGYLRCDPSIYRKQFCDYLEEAFDKKQLPEWTSLTLQDYFLAPDRAPPEFMKSLTVTQGEDKKAYNLLLDHYKKDYAQQTENEKNDRLEAFVNDKNVFNAYLKYIGNNNTYLSQDEAIIVAAFFKKRLRLFQRDWTPGKEKELRNQICNEEFQEEVCIYYTGSVTQHYERAEVRKIIPKPPHPNQTA